MDHKRAFASLERKLEKNVGHRVDLQFNDARKINKTTAQFMISYTDDRAPTSNDLGEFFAKFSKNANKPITPYMSTAKVYKSQKIVTVVGQILCQVREFADAKSRNMVPVIEGAVYLDVELKDTWEVDDREGNKVLVRKEKDDIMALVQARRNSMIETNPHQTFASTAKGDLMRYLRILEKGDQVRVFLNDKIVDAEVVAVSDGEVRVKHKSGTETVPRTSIVDVTARNPKDNVEDQKENYEYFKEAFGDEEYAKELVY